MEGIKLAKFIQNFSKTTNELFGESFLISELEQAIADKKLMLNDVKAFMEEDYKAVFEWIEDLKDCIAAIRGIARNPRTSLQPHDEVLNSPSVTRITNKITNTAMKHTEYWKKDLNGNLKPEKLIAPVFDDELFIYENRFIIFLINKLVPFMKNALSYLLAKVNFMEEKYIQGEIDFQEYMNLDNLGGLEKEAKEKAMLTNAPYLECIASLTQTINIIRYIKNSSFYKILRKSKPLKDEDIRVTNILASHPQYGKCYRFYIKLKRIDREFNEKPGIEFSQSYKDYVFVNLLLTLKQSGYTFYDEKINLVDKHIIIKEPKDILVGRHTSGAKIYLSCGYRKIYAKIVIKFDNEGIILPPTLTNRRTSWIEFDCIGNTKDEYNTFDLQERGRRIIGRKVGKTCTNEFIVSPFISNTKYSFLLSSPASFIENQDLTKAVNSATCFMEVDPRIYKHICPVCGKRIDVEDNVANYNCPHCYSTYSYLKKGYNYQIKDTVWIKRIGRPGRA